MSKFRVLLGFTQAPHRAVEETASIVLACMNRNPAYPLASAGLVDLQNALVALKQSMVLASDGGTLEWAEMNKKRDSVIYLLRRLAEYVEANCKNDLATLLSSGFSAVSTGRTPVGTGQFVGVRREADPGELQLARVAA